ncbi:MAG: phage holin family protein [Candidatus Nanopelagicales bacterium]
MDPLQVTGREMALYRLRADATNWRLGLVRLLVSGLAVIITFLVVPGLSFRGWHWGEFFLVAVVYGLLNALVKPLLQFFTLRYLVASYGLVVIAINAVVLWLLSLVLSDRVQYSGVFALLLGGAIIGIIGIFLETLLGTTRPILDDPAPGFSDAEPRPGVTT